MTESKYPCKLCGGETTRGFLADHHKSNYFVGKWIEGEPDHVEFMGLQGNVKTAGRRQFDIRSLRCEKCGYLELYAV